MILRSLLLVLALAFASPQPLLRRRCVIRFCRCVALLAWLVLSQSKGWAAVQLIGVQYQPDQNFPEFDCYLNHWAGSSYPTNCPPGAPRMGATVHAFIKNTGPGSVSLTNAFLAGYNLKTVIHTSTANYNPRQQSSIYFYWDEPPQAILDAGEPVWWKADPPVVPAGGVGRMAVRLRQIPTNWVSLAVHTTGGNVATNITVDANAPQVSSIHYSEDFRKVYLHWRRPASGGSGAAPTSVWLDGTNVTSLTTTVGDPNYNFAASVITLPNPLPFFSYHVFQGVYADGKVAGAGQRAWTNKFIYTTWSTFEESGNYTAANWLDEAANHGFNNIEMNLGAMGSYLGTVAGRNHCAARGYGYTIMDKTKLNVPDPDLWFLNDEPDGEENNQGRTHCGTGTRLPCDVNKYAGTLVMKETVGFAAELQALRPNVPTTLNLDGHLQPQSYYTWGPALDVLESNNYYEVRLRQAYLMEPNLIPLHRQAKLTYAIARMGSAGAAPNPFRHILYSCKGQDPDWPYPFPASKRIEAYYSLAGGSKGMGYWWFNPPRGLNRSAECAPLWKEMGLFGNEIKTVRRLIVRSTPVNMTINPNTPNAWVRAVAADPDTMIVYVVTDNYFNDQAGCHYTNVPNVVVTNTLPAWMVSPNTSAFEITKGGRPGDVNWTLNGNQFVLSLGTLELTRMIVITRDTGLRSSIQSWYDSDVKPGLCTFAPELCVNFPPSIGQQPANQTVAPGGTASFTIVAGGTSPLGFRWQKNNSFLSNGGHYSGATTSTLTISNADANDAANYRCIVTNAYGSITSSVVTLTVTNAPNLPPTITQHPSNQSVDGGGTANFTVAATGSEPLSYRWRKNNSNLTDAGHYSGATTTTLTITGADASDVGNYRCVVTNAYGSTTSASATLAVNVNLCSPGKLLGHGDMESPAGYGVCPDWTSYSAGNGVASWTNETVIVHGGAKSQRCRNPNGGAGSLLGIRQTIDANVGDAFTFEARVQPVSNPGAGQQVALVAVWDGSTANPTTNASTTWLVSTGARNAWAHLQNLAGNAASTNVTLFLDSRRTASSQDLTAYWDDIVAYRAHVPPAPAVGTISASSLSVDILPGCNTNPGAQFALSIGGGAYTLGTHWIQANGVISTSPVWQTDAVWGNKTVTGLTTGTPYTFRVQARYSSAIPQPTTLGAPATLAPAAAPQPPQLAFQRSGGNLILTWPESPGARLERAAGLTAPVFWNTVTNTPVVAGGQKNVTLPLSGAAAYFRLVLE